MADKTFKNCKLPCRTAGTAPGEPRVREDPCPAHQLFSSHPLLGRGAEFGSAPLLCGRTGVYVFCTLANDCT